VDDPRAPGATIPDPGASPSVRVLLADDFAIELRAGAVLGSTAGDQVRRGVDVERRLGVDDGALRIAALRTPGWARCALAYGPFLPEPGLSASVHVLNGHQASESYGIRSMRSQLLSWLRGSHTRPLVRRIRELLTDRRRMPVHRRVGEWVQHWRRPPDSLLNENLAVGFFAVPAPSSTSDLVAAFLVRGTGAGNGELTASVNGHQLAVAERITNIPFQLVVVVREDAIAYFASSLPGARGGAGHPMMRPLAIADGRPTVPVHLGVEQNVLGEIGFSVDTRVYGVRAAVLPDLARWPGTAHAADRLRGSGTFDRAESGQTWEVSAEGAARSACGLRTKVPDTLLLIDPGAPSALVRMRRGAPTETWPALVWRARPGGDHLRLSVHDGLAHLVCRRNGGDDVLAEGPMTADAGALEITDDGGVVRASVDGVTVLAVAVEKAATDATAVGLLAHEPAEYSVCDLEAHPTEVAVPAALHLPAAQWRAGDRVVVTDDFSGEADDLAGRLVETGAWVRRSGHGRFALDGGLVVAEAPDRTVYTVPWPHPGFADVTARVVPRRVGKRRSRTGVIFLEDDGNFVIVNLWFNDRPDGAASVSSFFRTEGREDVYDAVWVNVGDRVQWDRPVDVRAAFDGDHYNVALDGEPVLWRSLRDVYPRGRRLRVREVGLVANWEWGLDAGSRVERFMATTDGSAGSGDEVQHR
jgi:hypothetical protein